MRVVDGMIRHGFSVMSPPEDTRLVMIWCHEIELPVIEEVRDNPPFIKYSSPLGVYETDFNGEYEGWHIWAVEPTQNGIKVALRDMRML